MVVVVLYHDTNCSPENGIYRDYDFDTSYNGGCVNTGVNEQLPQGVQCSEYRNRGFEGPLPCETQSDFSSRLWSHRWMGTVCYKCDFFATRDCKPLDINQQDHSFFCSNLFSAPSFKCVRHSTFLYLQVIDSLMYIVQLYSLKTTR